VHQNLERIPDDDRRLGQPSRPLLRLVPQAVTTRIEAPARHERARQSRHRAPARGNKRPRFRNPLHIHWFRWQASAPFSNGSLYTCRCGDVRPGI
jgi:hypothetical protein